MQTDFSRPLRAWVRGAQVLLGRGLQPWPNPEPRDHNLYSVEGQPDLQLKVYYHAQVQFLWKGQPVPTRRNSELDQRLVLKWQMEAPLPWSALTLTSIEEALEFARDLK